jgi:hypothetical protein
MRVPAGLWSLVFGLGSLVFGFWSLVFGFCVFNLEIDIKSVKPKT